MTMRVLVTGGAGRLGRELVSHAQRGSIEFTSLDIRADRSGVVQGDVVDPDFIREAVAGYDAVVHAAALHGIHVKDHSDQRFLRTNVEGTGNVLAACVAAGVGHVVLMSSTSVYGLSARRPPPYTVFVDESTPCRPIDINDVCKVLAEEVAIYVSRRHGLPVTILRSGRFFVDDPVDFDIAKLTGAVDVADVAQATIRGLAAPPGGCEIYCVASETRFARPDAERLSEAAAELIEERYPGAAAALAARGRLLPERLHRVVDITKAREAIGYQPQHNFGDFVARPAGDRPWDTSRLAQPLPEVTT